MEDFCEKCGGLGMEIVEDQNGRRYAQRCDCRFHARIETTLRRAGIPNRYKGKTLRSYKTDKKDPSLYQAKSHALKFVDNYPFGINGTGLMFVGHSGLGKTHLAAGLLQELIIEKNVNGVFVDYHDLLKKIQNSYDRSVAATELSLLQPIFEAEILVIDDLGSLRPSDWVWDTVAHILNARYSAAQPTIITTNFENSPQTAIPSNGVSGKNQTLGDRIGDRMRSRLQEMCVVLEMHGEDYRETDMKADLLHL